MTYSLEALSGPSTATPSDYHRVHFDPSSLPSKRIVGLLACQRDPLLRKLRTKVVSARPASLTAPPPARGKEKKKKTPSGSGASTPGPVPNGTHEPEGKLWEVELEDTVIFPEGGGQPFDTGTLWIDGKDTKDRKSLRIEGCIRRQLDSVHLVRVPSSDASILDGLETQDVELEVDWERRVDHMTIHTSQHLLSAVLDTYVEGLPTLSWSMSAYPTLDPPYIELPRALTWAEAEEVERRCNELIAENKKIWVDVDMQGEGYVKMTAAGVRENRGIPQDYANGVIRHINIDGIDRNACCGTQLPFLSHLSFIHVLPPSTAIDSTKPSKAPTKLSFIAGPRGIKYLQQSSRTLSEASQALAASRSELPARVAKTEELRRETLSREKVLRAELAKVIGESTAKQDNQGVYWIHRREKSTQDFDFLGSIATALMDLQSSPGVLEAPVAVLSSASAGVTPSLILVLSPAQDLAKKVYDSLKAALEGEEKGRVKGGGARGRFMAKVEGKWGKAETEKVREIVETARCSS